jgi:large subunit ribosomal protein L7Ae
MAFGTLRYLILAFSRAAQVFKLLNKYRPETKAEKKERLEKEATAIAEGKKREDVSKVTALQN